MDKQKKIRFGLRILRYLPQTLWFNFHYLKFRDAYKLPILLYKPKFVSCKGSVKINSPVKFGMIKLGFNEVTIYPNTGIKWENKGVVEFNDKVSIENSSAVAIGERGKLIFEGRFVATCRLKLVCYHRVTFGNNVLVGWDCLFSDTDFHAIYTAKGRTVGYAPIKIGDDNWFAMQTICLKGTKTPRYCISSARSLLSKDYTHEGERILIGGSPARMIKKEVWRGWNDDKITYDCADPCQSDE